MAKTNNSYARQVAYTRPVTPSDSADLPGGLTRGLMVGADGDLAVVYADGTEDTITLVAGLVHPISVARIKSTSTTATGIKACY